MRLRLDVMGRLVVVLAFIGYCSFSIFAGHGSASLGEVLIHRPLAGGVLVPQILGWLGGAGSCFQIVARSGRQWSRVTLSTIGSLTVSLLWFFFRTEGSTRSLVLALPFFVFASVGLVLATRRVLGKAAL